MAFVAVLLEQLGPSVARCDSPLACRCTTRSCHNCSRSLFATIFLLKNQVTQCGGDNQEIIDGTAGMMCATR
jgi:hypothetical protein